MPGRSRKAPKPRPVPYVEPTWPHPESGEGAVSEFAAPQQGAVSPFGEGLDFPLPVEGLGYLHPTAEDRPNR